MRISKSGPEGNVFFIIGQTKKYMKEIGLSKDEAQAGVNRMMSAKGYDEAIAIAQELTDNAFEFVE
jgi:hypothetical protein|tara:strand:- start:253 stop:450 length:198 start_codon:yes stop_codon:yes gene_type:complete